MAFDAFVADTFIRQNLGALSTVEAGYLRDELEGRVLLDAVLLAEGAILDQLRPLTDARLRLEELFAKFADGIRGRASAREDFDDENKRLQDIKENVLRIIEAVESQEHMTEGTKESENDELQEGPQAT